MFVALLLVLLASVGAGVCSANDFPMLLREESGCRVFMLRDGSIRTVEWPRAMAQSDTFLVEFVDGSTVKVTATVHAYGGVEGRHGDVRFVVRQPSRVVTVTRATPRTGDIQRFEKIDLGIPDDVLSAWPLSTVRRVFRIDRSGKRPFPIQRPKALPSTKQSSRGRTSACDPASFLLRKEFQHVPPRTTPSSGAGQATYFYGRRLRTDHQAWMYSRRRF